jgi:hypothetical protein
LILLFPHLTLLITVLGVVIFVGAISGSTNPLNPLEKFTSGKIAVQNSEITFKKDFSSLFKESTPFSSRNNCKLFIILLVECFI